MPAARPALRFDRHEFAGAFGDIGTDLPLIVGVILASGMKPAGALIMFGAMQIATGLIYRMPLPVQPLKAMAAIIIAQKVPAPVIFGGGLAIGLCMLVLSLTGLVDALARLVSKTVVRGIQFGLGLQLAQLALRQYVPEGGAEGYAVGLATFVATVLLLRNRRVPAALVVIGGGLLYAAMFKLDWRAVAGGAGVRLPQFAVPARADIWSGFLLLALPQIPLSLGNSVLATRQVAHDLFPQRAPLTVRKISLTYALMNLVNPFFGGIPTCHGSGGMAGHYAFGGRTGGSVIVYGSVYVLIGLFFSGSFEHVIQLFPKPVLGILLLFEGLTLLLLVRDVAAEKQRWRFAVALLVGLAALSLPYGFLVGMIAGVILEFAAQRGVAAFTSRRDEM